MSFRDTAVVLGLSRKSTRQSSDRTPQPPALQRDASYSFPFFLLLLLQFYEGDSFGKRSFRFEKDSRFGSFTLARRERDLGMGSLSTLHGNWFADRNE